MSELLLDSLEIKNFRTFRHLQIEKLGRVNLITGKNSVGKTTLLEALRVYAGRGNPTLLWQLLSERDQGEIPSRTPDVTAAEQIEQLKNLFRKTLSDIGHVLEIGDMKDSEKRVQVLLDRDVPRGRGSNQLSLPSFEEDRVLSLAVRVGVLPDHNMVVIPLDRLLDRARVFQITDMWSRSGIENIRHGFVAARGSTHRELTRQWDAIALTPQEEDVIAALRLIAPDVERVTLTGEQSSSTARIPRIRRTGRDGPESLRSLGGGIERLLGISLALVNARDGFLLVDEIENGLHYTVQVNVWRLVFQVARRLNVQVFATTHSWDAIAAFQEAAREDTEAEGYLIRLETLGEGEVIATIFDESDLAIATREQIEVR